MKIKEVNEFVFCMCLYAFVLKFNSYWHDIIHLKTGRCKLNGGHRNCIYTPPPAIKSFLWTRFGKKKFWIRTYKHKRHWEQYILEIL